ncbi:hypothetical protein HJG60_008010 [Phyllostomus discolor]|uniref:Uncharacterized protein n=1 Tax=Phyllostomus discolor TaxID=89673 RepID=A0A834EVS9_9CHIR|nr:hypothetical protein HJG60_008010 [Phyllostomus discolor]
MKSGGKKFKLSHPKWIAEQNKNSVYNSSPNFLFSSKKEFPLLCFWGLEHGSPLDHLFQIAIHCCSQINPFCWGNIWLFVYDQHYYSNNNNVKVITSRQKKKIRKDKQEITANQYIKQNGYKEKLTYQ